MLGTQSQLFMCLNLMAGDFAKLQRPGGVNGIFVWGQASDNYQQTADDDGILELAAKLNAITEAIIIIPGYTGTAVGQTTYGYPGPEVWLPRLRSLGVPSNQIIALAGTGSNTKTEFEDCYRFAKAMHYRRIFGVTHYSHALRAMLGAAKTIGNRELLVAPMWPHRIDWNRPVHGSQGEGPYSRTTWLRHEFSRIPKYMAQGDLANLEELVLYLTRLHTSA